MSLCDVCKSISFTNLPDFPNWFDGYHRPIEEEDLVPYLTDEPKDGEKEQEPRELGVPYHKTLESLQNAARGSCKLCQQVMVGVARVLECLEIANNTDHHKFYDKSGGPSFAFYVCKRESGGDGFVVLSPAKDNNEVFLMAAIGFCADYDSPVAEQMRGRVTTNDRKDSRLVAHIRTWLQDCKDKHNHKNKTDAVLQAIVVDLGNKNSDDDAERVTLWEPLTGTTGDYAVLNHFRGLSVSITQEKLESYKSSGISVSDLPEVFKDAIWMTRELGLQYLWIDDLCNPENSADFYDIYTKSYILLSSVCSKSDSEGFLLAKKPCEYTPLSLLIHDKEATVFAFAILPAYECGYGEKYMRMPDEPLGSQAWSFQAHYLSPRKLYFGTTQVSFECSSHFVNEQGFLHSTPSNTLQSSYPEYEDNSMAKNSVWGRILWEYGTLELSRPSDKLLALSGIAKAVSRVKVAENEQADVDDNDDDDDEYAAGLWRSSILQGLCWQSVGGDGKRPQAYRAPSWSWASIDCTPGLMAADHSDVAQIEALHVDLKDSNNKYGQVTGGYIQLKAPLIRAVKSSLLEKDHGSGAPQRHVRLRIEGNEDEFGHYTTFDVLGEIDRDKIDELELYFLPLASFGGSCSRGECGTSLFVLVIQPWTGPGSLENCGTTCYRRVGWILSDFGNETYDWVASQKKEELATITLV